MRPITLIERHRVGPTQALLNQRAGSEAEQQRAKMFSVAADQCARQGNHLRQEATRAAVLRSRFGFLLINRKIPSVTVANDTHQPCCVSLKVRGHFEERF